MEYITGWIRNLIFMILFTTFLMMFLPGNRMRKYVRVVMGFFIITIFVSPLATIFNQNFADLSHIIPEKIVANDMNLIKEKGEELKSSNESMLKEYYSEKAEQQMKKLVEMEFPEWQNEIQVEVNDSYQIKQIQIILMQNLIKDIEIKPVQPGKITSEEDQKKRKESSRDLKTDLLKNKISNIFQVPLNIINVEIRGERDGDF